MKVLQNKNKQSVFYLKCCKIVNLSSILGQNEDKTGLNANRRWLVRPFTWFRWLARHCLAITHATSHSAFGKTTS
jgi:hypothetical protein